MWKNESGLMISPDVVTQFTCTRMKPATRVIDRRFQANISQVKRPRQRLPSGIVWDDDFTDSEDEVTQPESRQPNQTSSSTNKRLKLIPSTNESKGPETSAKLEANSISKTLQDMLREGYRSDFTLKVGDRAFPVHTNILGMRSKVFRSMFDSEMKEMQDNCVDIKGIDADTLERLLQFIYADVLDMNLDWKDICSLYAAADYYALEHLKQGCSTILKNKLSIASALGVLTLTNLHQDQQLKSAAVNFIALKFKDIVDTDDWKKFEKENTNLALETCRDLYLMKLKSKK